MATKSTTRLGFLIPVLILFQLKMFQSVSVKLYNVSCISHDPDFGTFELCQFKWTAQKMPSISLTTRLLQLPVKKADVRLELHAVKTKKTDVLFNNTWDACKALDAPKRVRFLKPFIQKISKFTDLNHSCPYGHDIHMRNYEPGIEVYPFPMFNGVYILKTIVLTGGKARVSVEWHIRTL